MKDLINNKYGKLTVIDFHSWYTKSVGVRIAKWLCKCDCGKEKAILGTSLQQGLTKSCGCLIKETASKSGMLGAYKDSGFQDLYRRYRNRSKFGFELTKEQFKELTSSNCYYCNRIPSQISKAVAIVSIGDDYIYNGVDRINSSLGYHSLNCVPCCGICNKMKNNMSHDDFINHIKVILKNLNE